MSDESKAFERGRFRYFCNIKGFYIKISDGEVKIGDGEVKISDGEVS